MRFLTCHPEALDVGRKLVGAGSDGGLFIAQRIKPAQPKLFLTQMPDVPLECRLNDHGSSSK
jgi:hypothetical protein